MALWTNIEGRLPKTKLTYIMLCDSAKIHDFGVPFFFIYIRYIPRLYCTYLIKSGASSDTAPGSF